MGGGHLADVGDLGGIGGLETVEESLQKRVRNGGRWRRREVSPWVVALRAERALPAAVLGPRERAPLRRAAWIWSLERLRM